MYKYRIYPSRKQKARLFNNFKTCKQIYNELLELSISVYKENGVTLNRCDFNKLIIGLHPEIYSQVKQNVGDRVHKSFQNFFRRCKDPSSKKKGFPRFKSRVNSITYPQRGFKFLSEKRLRVSKIGSIPIVLHRVPKGKLKTMTIKKNRADQWFAVFACEIEEPVVKHQSNKHVGIDVGIENLAITSDNEFFDNPHFLVKSEKRLKRLHRNLSRKKKGSNNRRKARYILSKQYVKVTDQRSDYLHKLSFSITKKYSFIAVEKLKIKNMVRDHHLAKSISDVSWYRFINMLSYKAVKCGGQLVQINPKNTSKTCSSCKTIVDMPLHKRQFKCPVCGLVIHRDLNAAINILRVGQDLPEFTPLDRPTSAKPNI